MKRLSFHVTFWVLYLGVELFNICFQEDGWWIEVLGFAWKGSKSRTLVCIGVDNRRFLYQLLFTGWRWGREKK